MISEASSLPVIALLPYFYFHTLPKKEMLTKFEVNTDICHWVMTVLLPTIRVTRQSCVHLIGRHGALHDPQKRHHFACGAGRRPSAIAPKLVEDVTLRRSLCLPNLAAIGSHLWEWSPITYPFAPVSNVNAYDHHGLLPVINIIILSCRIHKYQNYQHCQVLY